MALTPFTQEMEVLRSSIHAVSTSYLIGRESTGLYPPITVNLKERVEGSQIRPCQWQLPVIPVALLVVKKCRWATGFSCTFVKYTRQKRRWKREVGLGYIQAPVAHLPYGHSGVKRHIISSSSSSIFALTLELQIRAFTKTVQFYHIYKDFLFEKR